MSQAPLSDASVIMFMNVVYCLALIAASFLALKALVLLRVLVTSPYRPASKDVADLWALAGAVIVFPPLLCLTLAIHFGLNPDSTGTRGTWLAAVVVSAVLSGIIGIIFAFQMTFRVREAYRAKLLARVALRGTEFEDDNLELDKR